MVDMVEARKRAKRSLAEKLEAPEPFSPPVKPVLRSEPKIQEESSVYFPMAAPPAATKEKIEPAVELPEPVPMESVPEDQVDFMQRLFQDETDEEDAERLAESAHQDEELETLVFQLGSEHYGIGIHQIAEIIRFVEPTEVPNTVSFLDGIISLRGHMIPVINGRRRLGHPAVPTDKKTRIIVLAEGSENLGILVDSASQVIRLPTKEIEPTPPVVSGVDAEFIQGVCEHQSHLIILLNLERFLRFSH